MGIKNNQNLEIKMDDIILITEGEPDEVVGWLKERVTQSGQFWRKRFKTESGTPLMERYLEELKKEGLDIGKGSSQYGYRMPLPEREEEYRSLEIFRR